MSMPENFAVNAFIPSPLPEPSLIGALVPIIALLLIFGMPVVIVISVLRHKANRARLLQETILKLAEKGHPIPQQLLEGNIGESGGDWRKKPPLHKGIVLTAVGSGLITMLLSMNNRAWGAGMIPLLMGIGYLIIWRLESRNTR